MEIKKDKFRYFLKSDDDSWHSEYVQEDLKNLDVIYSPKWCHGFRVIPRENANPLIEMLCEDDGQLFSEEVTFDVYWAEKIIEALQETVKYTKEKYILDKPRPFNCRHHMYFSGEKCFRHNPKKECKGVCENFEWREWIEI